MDPADEIIANAIVALQTARRGVSDLNGDDPSRRIAGFRNAVVFGRSVTNVLEHLRSKVPDFDAWYKPRSAALGRDPSFKKLYDLRSQILKEGSGQAQAVIHMNGFSTTEIQPILARPPRGARGFFIGDNAGGSGWEIDLGDGEIEKVYVALPSTNVSYSYNLDGEDAVELLNRYLDELAKMIRAAEEHFGIGKARAQSS